MTAAPLLSYIVLSYNYEHFIGTTIRSILEQTVQDFEIVVVDDGSRDGSIGVIEGFNDPRIRLLVNPSNIGGAASYNRAVEAARGEWLVNLDEDDWTLPDKAEIQLREAARDPRLDIIGTFAHFVDDSGAPHPNAAVFEEHVNVERNLNLVDSWVGGNYLCRSTTMVRRSAHLRFGLDDPGMVRAPDYELWTRALRHDCRFAVIPERLIYYRVHGGGITHGDPVGTMLEMAYAALRNLIPTAEARALNPTVGRILHQLARNSFVDHLPPAALYRLFGIMMASPALVDYQAFRAALYDGPDDAVLSRVGRRALGLDTIWDRIMKEVVEVPVEVPVHIPFSTRDPIGKAYEFWHSESNRSKLWRISQLGRKAFSRYCRFW